MAYSAPNAPTLSSPIGSVTIDYSAVQQFSWVFSDSAVGDTPSQFDLQYRVVGAGSWILISQTTPNSFYNFPAGTLTANNYEWQVRNYDAIGLVGPWSSSSFFTAATAPSSLTITAPLSGATVNALPVFTWSTPAQTDYQVRRCRDIAGVIDTTTVYYDSGDVVDSVSRTVNVSLPTNNRYEWIQVRVESGGLWSAWVGVKVFVSYIQPSPGTVLVTLSNSNASLVITTTAAAVGGGEPTPISVDIYIRAVGTTGYGDRVAAKLTPTGVWPFWTPASGVSYEARTLTTGSNGAQRWSSVVFTHIFDGGTAVAPGTAIALDGGNASTVFTNTVDGGTP